MKCRLGLSIAIIMAMTAHGNATWVAQDNIHTTICASDWEKKHGAPAGYMAALKQTWLEKYPEKMKTWDVEYIIPLELGGDDYNEQNFKVMPLAGDCGALVKRQVGRDLRDLVCRGAVSLDGARVIASQHWCAPYVTKWIAVEKAKILKEEAK